MKHEYSSDELRELKSIYDESGEAGLSRDEMRALRKAGFATKLLTGELMDIKANYSKDAK